MGNPLFGNLFVPFSGGYLLSQFSWPFISGSLTSREAKFATKSQFRSQRLWCEHVGPWGHGAIGSLHCKGRSDKDWIEQRGMPNLHTKH